MFKIHCLPARFGDSFWITYGSARKQYHILIDGGTSGTRQDIVNIIKKLPADRRQIELAVVTHIDNDHIGGILALFEKNLLQADIQDLWFNDRRHLPASPYDLLGVPQGIRLADELTKKKIRWNVAFKGDAVQVAERGALRQIDLDGGMKVTLLSPTSEALARLQSSGMMCLKSKACFRGNLSSKTR